MFKCHLNISELVIIHLFSSCIIVIFVQHAICWWSVKYLSVVISLKFSNFRMTVNATFWPPRYPEKQWSCASKQLELNHRPDLSTCSKSTKIGLNLCFLHGFFSSSKTFNTWQQTTYLGRRTSNWTRSARSQTTGESNKTVNIYCLLCYYDIKATP